MESQENIQQFDEMVGKIFAHLYAKFPVPVVLTPEPFVQQATRHDFKLGEIPTKETEFFLATVEWLAKEGYLRYRNRSQLWVDEVVLTNQCLQLLNIVPDSLQASIGSQLVEASKEAGKGMLQELASEVLKKGAGILGSGIAAIASGGTVF